MEWLQDKSLTPFFEKIAEVSKSEENFRAKNIEEMGEEKVLILAKLSEEQKCVAYLNQELEKKRL